MFLHLVYEEHRCKVIKTEGRPLLPPEGAVCVCVDTSFVQLSVQEGQSSGDTMSHAAARKPVHCVDRQVVRQAALKERQRDFFT